jgi:ABC-type transport system involved in cytochrome c biogenesis permease subunit
MISYALLGFTFMNALVGVWLPEADERSQQLTLLSRLLLYPAVLLLFVGIFLGSVWANVSWGTYWSWDPNESWALITLLVYSIPLHAESLPWFRSTRNYRIYSLLAFACLLMTYLGVNYLLGGMHSYN